MNMLCNTDFILILYRIVSVFLVVRFIHTQTQLLVITKSDFSVITYLLSCNTKIEFETSRN